MTSKSNIKSYDLDYIWHPFTQMKEYAEEEPLVIEDSDGVYLIDSDGKKYIDGVSSLWVNIHGHKVEKIDNAVKKQLNKNSHSTAVGDEGGFAPDLKSNEEALSFISEAVSNAGYKLGSEVYFALDVAATEIYKNKKYRIDKKDLNVEEISIYYQKLIDKYPIISIEDPLDEDDWDGWAMLTNLVGDKVQLVGDDLFVTNNSRLQTGIDKSAGNSILIKINQIGSISETLQAIDLAKKNNYSYIISHRSGETEDAIIADISVATNSGQIKTGSCSRTDRTAKYNQLLRIEDSLGKKAKFAKLKTFNTIA